jgi:hypothetical protein
MRSLTGGIGRQNPTRPGQPQRRKEEEPSRTGQPGERGLLRAEEEEGDGEGTRKQENE